MSPGEFFKRGPLIRRCLSLNLVKSMFGMQRSFMFTASVYGLRDLSHVFPSSLSSGVIDQYLALCITVHEVKSVHLLPD